MQSKGFPRGGGRGTSARPLPPPEGLLSEILSFHELAFHQPDLGCCSEIPALAMAAASASLALRRSSMVSRTLKRPGLVGSGGHRESETYAAASAFIARSRSGVEPIRFRRVSIPSKIDRQTGSRIREYSVLAHALAVPPCQAAPFSMFSMNSLGITVRAVAIASAGVASS